MKASGDVRAENKVKETLLKAEKISYFKNENKITTKGKHFMIFNQNIKEKLKILFIYSIKII